MKVLFQAYNTCCQTESGGVQVRVRKIKQLLENRGLYVDFFSPFSTKIKDYDVLHIFSLKEESLGVAITAKKLGLKVVVSPIVNTTAWRAKAIRNTLLFPHVLRCLGIEPIEYQRYEILQLCDCIFVESKTEGDFISKYYKVDSDKIKIVPNGVEEQPLASKSIYEKINPNRKFVLQVGRVDSNKNTLNTIKAVKGADYDLVIIGGKFAGAADLYYEECVKEGMKLPNVHFLGWLDSKSDMLASAYQNSQAVVMPSKSETFGLVAVEAAMAGTHVCLSDNLAILDFGVFRRDFTFNSSDPKDIRRVLDKAMNTPKDNTVKELAKKIFSWDKIIDEHINTYKC